ncbi:MAG: serine kinase [Planctomycetes bacterium]|nr:serine kinase [Planctomycetota bacterium]
MKLGDIVEGLGLENLTPELPLEGREAAGGHVSDLLSDVLANAPRGGVLVTIQVHMNVLAVAAHAGLAAVVFAAGRAPEPPVRARAVEEEIPLLRSTASAFDIVGELYALGIKGRMA